VRVEPVPPAQFKRLRRREVPGEARALNFSCFSNQAFLRSERACTWLAESVVAKLPEYECDLWAFCFMPTHALVYPRAGEPNLGGFLEAVKKSVSVKALRWVTRNAPEFLPRMRDEQPNGNVSHRFWQRGGGYDRNMRTGRAIWHMIRYIHRDPVRDGLCRTGAEWKWSSACWYKERREPPVPLCLERLPRWAR
jgi:putative transposase